MATFGGLYAAVRNKKTPSSSQGTSPSISWWQGNKAPTANTKPVGINDIISNPSPSSVPSSVYPSISAVPNLRPALGTQNSSKKPALNLADLYPNLRIGLQGMPAANAAGANASNSAAASTATTASPNYGGYIDTALGVPALYNQFREDIKDDDKGSKEQITEGAGTGLAIGSNFGPYGMAIGAAAGGLVGAGLAGYHKLTGNDTDVEDKRWEALREAGVAGYENPFQEERYVGKGELLDPTKPADFVGYNERGEWINNRFSQTRDERDYVGQDISGRSAWGERYGSEWASLPPEVRNDIAQKAIDSGLVREHHGTVDINFTPELEAYAAQRAAEGVKPKGGSKSGGGGNRAVKGTEDKPKKKKPRRTRPVYQPRPYQQPTSAQATDPGLADLTQEYGELLTNPYR